MEKFLKFLLSNRAVLLATMLSLATQLWHSVTAFVALEQGDPNWATYFFGILFSVGTSFAILLFTVRGRTKTAFFFFFIEVFINVIHYNVMGMELGALMFSTIFMCIIVPINIAVYSAEIDPDEKEEKAEEPLASTHALMNDYIAGFDPIKPVTSRPRKIKDESFIGEVNKMLGFDVTNPTDNSGNVPENAKIEIRKLWKQRKNTPAATIITQIKEILTETQTETAPQNGKQLFN